MVATGQSMSIADTIAKLKGEITRGSPVYSSEELNTLSSKLTEYENLLTQMEQRSHGTRCRRKKPTYKMEENDEKEDFTGRCISSRILNSDDGQCL